MKLPQTYKGILKLLITIAEEGNNFNYTPKLTDKDKLVVGAIIADIQNGLGDAEETLEKLNLKYDGSIR